MTDDWQLSNSNHKLRHPTLADDYKGPKRKVLLGLRIFHASLPEFRWRKYCKAHTWYNKVLIKQRKTDIHSWISRDVWSTQKNRKQPLEDDIELKQHTVFHVTHDYQDTSSTGCNVAVWWHRMNAVQGVWAMTPQCWGVWAMTDLWILRQTNILMTTRWRSKQK